MVRQPKSLSEAREIVREERIKFTTAVSTVAGSRWLMAILATFVLAFGVHLAYAPNRLPPVAGLSVATFGLPTDLDFGFVGEQAQEAAAAADRQDVRGRAEALAAANAERVPTINAVGFGAALVLLFINMTIMTKRRRTTRG
jgi:hypothetical protein